MNPTLHSILLQDSFDTIYTALNNGGALNKLNRFQMVHSSGAFIIWHDLLFAG